MKQTGYLIVALLGLFLGSPPLMGAGAEFDEVYQLLRSNLSDLSEADLDRAAVEGLVARLSPRVSLVTNAPTEASSAKGISKTVLFDDSFAYFRFDRVGVGLDIQFQDEFKKLSEGKKLRGILFDLRFSEGSDYAQAAAIADRFVAGKESLMDWGDGAVMSKEKTDAIQLPVVILVNQQTSGSSEALAAVLREHLTALLIGSRTSGKASIAREFSLKNGMKLRVVTTPLRVKEKPLSFQGLDPDVLVFVKPEAELDYLEDPYKNLGEDIKTVTADSFRTNRLGRRSNEAELVRRHREGLNPDGDEPSAVASNPGPSGPILRDPTLVRGLDLLKGLAVLKRRTP